jgi:hypothetical protein
LPINSLPPSWMILKSNGFPVLMTSINP